MKQKNLIALIFLISGCSTNLKKDKKVGDTDLTTDHFNITIASDLSNRLNTHLYPRSVSDVDIVKTVVDDFYPTILNHKRSMNQLDQLRIGFINKKQISFFAANTKAMNFDFSRFKSQKDRIEYLRKDYKTDKKAFLTEFKRIHDKAVSMPFGSDIWTYLQQGVDEFTVNRETTTSQIGATNFKNSYRNVLILLTDGYIETTFKNNGYDLTANKIGEFRKKYLKSGEKDIEHFYLKNQQYRVHPLTNPLLPNLEVLVLELYDRSETNAGASVHPTDLEIMKLLWSDWLKNSNVHRAEFYPKFSDKAEAEKVISKFLGV